MSTVSSIVNKQAPKQTRTQNFTNCQCTTSKRKGLLSSAV